MFITKDEYNYLKEEIKRQDNVIDEYIRKNAKLKTGKYELKSGTIRALLFLKSYFEYNDNQDFEKACSELAISYVISLDEDDRDFKDARERLPENWRYIYDQHMEWKKENNKKCIEAARA